MVRPILPRPFDRYERRFRRRYFEKDELLGRGRTLEAFANGDVDFLAMIAGKRIKLARRQLARKHKDIYFDVSKFFARGLHVGFSRALPSFDIVLLVRDPVSNMRSYLNRAKNFSLDNVSPDAPCNLLRLDPRLLDKGQHYLWIWSELYLRFCKMREERPGNRHVVIRTGDLSDPQVMAGHLNALGLEFSSIGALPPQNTNIAAGLPPTQVLDEDLRRFEDFLKLVPDSLLRRIDPADLSVSKAAA